MIDDKKPKTEKDPNENNQNDDHETFGNEPPVKDPKPAKQPDKYEVSSVENKFY